MDKSTVLIEKVNGHLRDNVETIFHTLAPNSFNGGTVLIKPNMVGPSAPELGHTTDPELVQAVVQACLDRGAKVSVGDNPGGMKSSSAKVAKITGILDASNGCFKSISERVSETKGVDTGFPLVVSNITRDADYVINLPRMKTHLFMYVTGALKNTYGYVAGACKAKLHLDAPHRQDFAKATCDIYQVRPPELNIMDAKTAIEGNGPCHGGHMRQVGKLLASTDAVALDSVMARMMGADPQLLPVQYEAGQRGLGNIDADKIDIIGEMAVIPDFKMPITFAPEIYDEEARNKLKGLYPRNMMQTRVTIKPIHEIDKCTDCLECVESCPVEALTMHPEFVVDDKCISCFCCVELCPEGALEVPDIEAFQHY